MTMFLHEYRNQHAHRRYPFADVATLTSAEGTVLPSDAFVDAFLYPIDLVGFLYVAELDVSTRTIRLADSGTGAVCGAGAWQAGDVQVRITDMSGFSRDMGVFVFGPGMDDFQSPDTPMLFAPDGLPLTPTAFMGLNQLGVRGFVTEPTQLSTGSIKLEGANGVVITTYTANSKSIVRIDIFGAAPGGQDCACTPIERLLIENVNCPPVIGAHAGDGVLTLAGGFDAGTLCPPAALPDADGNIGGDACAPAPPPPEWPCPPDSTDVVPVVGGRIEIVAPSTLDRDNPVHVDAVSAPAELPVLDVTAGTSDIQARLAWLLKSGARPGGYVRLGLRRRK